MSRLIDADRAIEIVRNRGIAHPNAYHLTNYATLILQEAPTVDAVDIANSPNMGCGLYAYHFLMETTKETFHAIVNEVSKLPTFSRRIA